MRRSSELSDFEKGIIIGYHKCGRSLRDISSDLKYPKSTVTYAIKKWKVSGDCRNVPRVGRPTKLGDRGRRVFTREIRKNRTLPMPLIHEEFQQVSGSIVSMNTIRKEAHLHGFHGRAAAHKPLITKSNRAAREREKRIKAFLRRSFHCITGAQKPISEADRQRPLFIYSSHKPLKQLRVESHPNPFLKKKDFVTASGHPVISSGIGK
ncbi:transposable element Tc1 transposase [Caerostris extrusa]|uniref:Transposable element Tc1 transposase n=1 Tax=Caerostris extrusa TaxID=172846 RepID=A0AAV4YA83_CAEEX|nr:transposable element Tc1 transposase [Caerostris extrusa]